MKNPILVFIAAMVIMIIAAFTFSTMNTLKLQDKITKDFKLNNVEVFWSEVMPDGEGRYLTYYLKDGKKCSSLFFERDGNLTQHNETCGVK